MSGRISCGCDDDPDVVGAMGTTRPVCSDQSEAHHQLDGLNELEIGFSYAFEIIPPMHEWIKKSFLSLISTVLAKLLYPLL